MNDPHPDDSAFLNGVTFTSTYLRRYCDRCKKERHTVIVGGIEAGTGPGWDLRFCHPCVAAVLADAMKQSELKTGKPLRNIELPTEDGSNDQKEPPQVTPPPGIVTTFFDGGDPIK